MAENTLLSYYRNGQINPVPISLEDETAWNAHVAKRSNLYEKHLGIPLSLLAGKSVLEFGCNSGENALVLATAGANLTLVEPNKQVHPRLRGLFRQFSLEDRLTALTGMKVEEFYSAERFDLVIAEGFLNALQHRDLLLKRICGFIKPRGLGIISFDDRAGHFMELTRKLVFHRAFHLAAGNDLRGPASLQLAEELFLEDFHRINTSRPFSAWWTDVLTNPFVAWQHLWSYQELIPVLEEAGGEFIGSSPRWGALDERSWYKNIRETTDRHRELLAQWTANLPYFLSGSPDLDTDRRPDSVGTVREALFILIQQISDYICNPSPDAGPPDFPDTLHQYLSKSQSREINDFSAELNHLYRVLKSTHRTDIITGWHKSKLLRNFWGCPYHYVSFKNVQ